METDTQSKYGSYTNLRLLQLNLLISSTFQLNCSVQVCHEYCLSKRSIFCCSKKVFSITLCIRYIRLSDIFIPFVLFTKKTLETQFILIYLVQS